MLTIDPASASQHRRYPSISLLVPVAGATPWPARLRRLARDAEQRLRLEFGDEVDERLLERLTAAVAEAVLPRGARSLAVYVNAEVTSVVGLRIEVRERAVVDETFATRDLVAADLRQPRYWVLALNLADPQLLRGHGSQLLPQPLQLIETAPRPSTERSGRGRDRSAVTDAHRTRRLRAIDMAIAPVLANDRDPLLVVGAEPTVSRFVNHTRHAARIEGVVRRAPAAPLAALAESVAPAVTQMLGERRLVDLDHLERAEGSASLASGIEPVLRSTRRTPGLLLVEDHFEQPARITADGRLDPVEDPSPAGIVDDAVDEIIETVLAAGGRVELVPDGVLAHHQHIAFIPWRARRKRRAPAPGL